MTHRHVENNQIGQSVRITDVVQHHRAMDTGNATGKNEMNGHTAPHDDAIVIVWPKTGVQSR